MHGLLEQMVDPASSNKIPTKKSLKERKCNMLNESHKNGQFGDRAWKLSKESVGKTPRTQEKKTT